MLLGVEVGGAVMRIWSEGTKENANCGQGGLGFSFLGSRVGIHRHVAKLCKTHLKPLPSHATLSSLV